MLEDDGYSRDISTHAPLAGRDFLWYIISMKPFGFQPTRPLRGATDDLLADAVPNEISTHAPLAGRDILWSATFSHLSYFNPRAPCGARPVTDRAGEPT